MWKSPLPLAGTACPKLGSGLTRRRVPELPGSGLSMVLRKGDGTLVHRVFGHDMRLDFLADIGRRARALSHERLPLLRIGIGNIGVIGHDTFSFERLKIHRPRPGF